MKTKNRTIRPSRGFTLTEVMIAVGILAMALPMIASSLMAGMIAKKEAVEKTMATILSENAISLLQIRASNRDPAFPADWGVNQLSLQRVPDSVLSISDKIYKPCGETSYYAFEVLGQRVAAGANDFRFAVVVYRTASAADPENPLAGGSAGVTLSSTNSGAVDSYSAKFSGSTDNVAIYCYLTRLSLRQ